MKTIKLNLGGTGLVIDITLGKDENVYNIVYMGEILQVKTKDSIVYIDMVYWLNSLKLKNKSAIIQT